MVGTCAAVNEANPARVLIWFSNDKAVTFGYEVSANASDFDKITSASLNMIKLSSPETRRDYFLT